MEWNEFISRKRYAGIEEVGEDKKSPLDGKLYDAIKRLGPNVPIFMLAKEVEGFSGDHGWMHRPNLVVWPQISMSAFRAMLRLRRDGKIVGTFLLEPGEIHITQHGKGRMMRLLFATHVNDHEELRLLLTDWSISQDLNLKLGPCILN